MDFNSHGGITLIFLAGLRYRLFAYLTFICLYPFNRWFKISSTCFNDLNLYEAVKSSGFVVQLKLKCLLMKLLMMTTSNERKVTFHCLLKDIKGS